jgi:hypothetical protein
MGEVGEFDWMVVCGESYARNRSSFKTYRRVHGTSTDGANIVGIGTVELSVPRSSTDSSEHVLVLRDVLHIPTAICNGFSLNSIDHITNFGAEGVQGFDRAGNPIWYSERFAGLSRLVLAGNPQGESQLKDGTHYFLSVYVDPEEMTRMAGNHDQT